MTRSRRKSLSVRLLQNPRELSNLGPWEYTGINRNIEGLMGINWNEEEFAKLQVRL